MSSESVSGRNGPLSWSRSYDVSSRRGVLPHAALDRAEWFGGVAPPKEVLECGLQSRHHRVQIRKRQLCGHVRGAPASALPALVMEEHVVEVVGAVQEKPEGDRRPAWHVIRRE